MNKVIRRYRGKPLPPNTAYIGRPSRWGNPFIIGQHGNRAETIALYEAHITRKLQEGSLDITTLAGKDLACWCAPLPCHGDVLLRLAEA